MEQHIDGGKDRAKRLLYLGVDLGTTRLKAGLFDERGTLLAQASKGYPTYRPERGAAEQDGRQWWDALCACCRELGSHPAAGPEPLKRVGAVCVVGQGPTVVAADERGEPVRPAVTWADTRCQQEAEEIGAFAGYSSLARAMWIARHDAEACARARWFFQAFDYLSFRLTGEPVTVMPLVNSRPWSPEQIQASGIDPALFPERMLPPGHIMGYVTQEAASATGLVRGTPVISGTVDSFSHWVGVDMSEIGRMCDIGGTSEGLAVSVPEPVTDDKGRVWPRPTPAGGWVVSGAMSNGAGVLEWFRSRFFGDGAGYDEVIAEIAAVPPGAGGVIALPYLRGERVPIRDPAARGCFVGIGLEHGRAHLGRALLESVAFGIRSVVDVFREMGIEVRRIVATGGAARIPLWNQIKADVLGREVYVPTVTETGILGAAIIARAGLEKRPIGEIASGMVTLKERYEPEETNHARYQGLYARFRSLYEALREEFALLDAWVKEGGGRAL